MNEMKSKEITNKPGILDSMIFSLPVPIFYKDTNGKYLGCNKEYQSFFNIREVDFIGKTVYDFYEIDDADKYAEKDNELLSHPGKQVYTWKLRNGSNELCEVIFHKATFNDSEGNIAGIVGAIIDVTESNRAERALSESESQFRILTETTPSAVMIYQEDKFVYVNEASTRITEYSEEELLGMNFWEFVHPDDRERVKSIGEKRQKGYKAISRHQFKIIAKSGSIKWVDLAGSTTLYKGNSAGIISVNDVTKVIENNEKLRESEERARLLSSVTFEGILIHKKGIAIDVNQSFLKITGYTKEEVIGKNVLNYIPLSKDKLMIMSQIVRKRAKPYSITVERKDGSRFIAELEGRDIQHNGKTIRIAAVRDISERYRIQEALKESEERLELAVKAAFLGLWDMDYKTNRVYRTKEWAEMLGYKLEETQNDNNFWLDLIHPDDLPEAKKNMVFLEKKGNNQFRNELRLRCKDGSYKWILNWGRIVKRDSRGKPLRGVGVHIDIDDRKRAEEEVQELLKSKEILLKEVHHRIKNNMSSLASFLSIQSGLTDNSEAKSILQEARTRVQSMGVLYDKLYRSENYRELSVRDYISKLTNEITGLFPNLKDIEVKKDLDDFIIDTNYFFCLGIILNELLTNAMKYAFKGRKNNLLIVKAKRKGKKAIISVADNGVGISEETINNKTGFGLDLIDMLVKQIKGELLIDTKNGTKFTIRFDL